MFKIGNVVLFDRNGLDKLYTDLGQITGWDSDPQVHWWYVRDLYGDKYARSSDDMEKYDLTELERIIWDLK